MTRELAGRLVFGRGDLCEVPLPGVKLSRRHAEIYRQGPAYALRDLDSRNGTFVDGRRVQHCAVRSNMVVRFGDWLGIIEELDPSERNTAPFAELAPGLFGGPRLARALRTLDGLAASDLPISIVGATGTGKELVARACHTKSGRSGPFHAVNCATLPIELAEAELFGYKKGAFTGADRAHRGHLRAAAEGTLFLDEIAELPLPIQAKLLRATERAEVIPLGDTQPAPFRARIVVAGQDRLSSLVSHGLFREDLAMRLSGAEIQLPALRERLGDVPRLFHRFLFALSGGRCPEVSTELYERLCTHSWPGNVRELELLARRLMAEYPLEPRLSPKHLPKELQTTLGDELDDGGARQPQETRNDHDLRRFHAALKGTGGNVSLAAQIAGISRQRAYRLLRPSETSTGDPDHAS